MTTPQPGAPQSGPYPQQPATGQTGPYGQQPYPQQPYPQQPYPAYAGAPGVYAAAAPGLARPGMVTAAAVLSFIWGGLAIIGALISMLVGGVASSVGSECSAVTTDVDCDAVSGAGTLLIIIGIGLIVVAGLLIWGGVVALSGKDGRISVIACGILVILEIVEIIASGGVAFAIFGIIVPVLIIVFLMNTASKNWFTVKGGKHF